MVGRIVMALFATALTATALYFGVIRDTGTTAAVGSRAELDVTRQENGPPPKTFDTGQSALIAKSTQPGAELVIRDGKLTFEPNAAGSAGVFYGTPDMQRPITKMGASWVFLPRKNTAGGAISLIVSHGAHPSVPSVDPPLPIQLIVTPVSWNLGVRKDDASEVSLIAAGNFYPPLAVDGTTTHEVSVLIDGSRVNVDLPDGTKVHANDARVAQWEGDFALFGLYANDGLTDSVGGYQKIWAESLAGAP
jgi:hypothetical protein